MEKRDQLEGNPQETAKGQTQRWQPLLPHLLRVNTVARRSGQTRFTALLHHVDVAALRRAFKRQRRAASPGVDRVTVDEYERPEIQDELEAVRPFAKRVSAPEANDPSSLARSSRMTVGLSRGAGCPNGARPDLQG